MMTIFFNRFENIVVKGENAGYQHFLLLPQYFQKLSFSGWLTLSETTNFDPSKLKVFPDDNFKFDGNGRKFSKWVESNVGKGEIACYEQFLLFPQCFQKDCMADT